ncbi:fatty acid synthase-like [Polistes fuscatus]|uniref:fatty acid synthase-like n=1 Tax=Polistes fuscatus TaxID=30207 RepID=UPI001CA8B95E|nr:fatty acid synthase-like [Polistes fuscatus]
MKFKDFDDDAVVISGISGKFPNSDSIDELTRNLMNGEDCVSSDHTKWKYNDAKVPARIGKLSQIKKFDNICFGINAKQTHFIEPAARLAMEITFEAITDAGINPVEIRNTKTNIYGTLSLCESDKAVFYEKMEQNGLNLTGVSRAMMSNRISFCMDFIGSSCTFDSTCSSCGVAIQRAYEALKSKICDYAIISSGITILHLQISYHMSELGLLSPDGVNRSFDEKANGFSRSESIGAIFLQRAKNARRIYAEVVNATVMYGENIPRKSCLYPTAKFQAKIMKQTLKHCGLKPSDINYIEADGTAIKSMDREELKAIDLVYGENRSPSNPLLIGSIKSNIGHTLNNNVINSIIKVLIAMETGVIPPNLHYDKPPEDAKCLQDGRVKVVTKPTPLLDDYVAVNTASLNGSFSHIILKRHSKEKQKRDLSPHNMPRLFVISCRNEEMISSIFNVLKQCKGDDELAQLINDITKKPFTQSLYSGYIIIPELEEANSEQAIELIQHKSRQIWFVFSGMGSQWIGMGESLMKIPIFAEAMKKCDAVLRPRGYDIVHIICDKDPEIYDNIIHCFLGIAAIQIGLVDILNAVGVQPDYMIGHSVGELGCSYADGCFTAEEMILSALSRGLASVESDLIDGRMAAIGLGYQQVRHFCPADIDVACHNGPDSSTISGPTESINAFVKELQNKGIFAKSVPTNNIAYHSRYISPAGPKLLDYLKEVIPRPKRRSKRWISTSIPKNEWDSTKARFSSPEYHTNNLLFSVLFEEVLKMIPKNAVTIEISPHGLLQAILKKSLHSDCINLSLTKRNHKDNATLILSTLGKLYNLGYPITPDKLYPKIPYPVSRGTPSISSHIRWEHNSDWYVCLSSMHSRQRIGERSFLLNLGSNKYKFLQDFQINGNVIIPSAVYLKLVADMYLNFILNEAGKSLTFHNILIHNKLLKSPRNGKMTFTIMILKGTGDFEIRFNEEVIASGTISLTKTGRNNSPEIILQKEEIESLSKEDIYSNLLLRGYKYRESYNIIRGLSKSCSNGTLEWNNDWTLLLEGLIQVQIINSKNRNILMPSMIKKLVIDVEQLTEQMNEKKGLPIKYEKRINTIACPGITAIGIELKEILIENRASEIIMDELRFIENVKKTKMDMDDVTLEKEDKFKRTVVVTNQKDCIDKLTICLRDSKCDNVIFLVNTIIESDIFEILRIIKREPGYKKLQIFDLQYAKAPKFSLQNKFYQSQIKLNLRENVLSTNGVWGTYRWTPLPMKSTHSSRWCAKMSKSGSLEWIEELPLIKETNKSIVKVKCAAFDLNVYEYCLKNDVSLESQISIVEYSGLDEKGRRVMGLVDNFTISNEISADPDFTWIIPENWSFEDAATIPQAYFAAFCILHSNTYRLKCMKTVLVHFGASDVGQALINLSLSYNLDVYTTYETEAEKRIIESIRPSLPQSHIINVKDYGINIKTITNGKGIDFVVANYSILNDIDTSLDVVAALKHLAMIYDSKDPHYKPLSLVNFFRHKSVYGYCLQDLIKLPQKVKERAAELMRNALQAGTLKPIVSRKMNLRGATEERNTEACQRYGKVLINLEEEKEFFDLIPQYFFPNDKYYFVVEGFNTFGKLLIEWMIEQGVRKLFLVSDKPIRDHEQWLLKLRESGATVVTRDEINTTTSFNELLKEAVSLYEIEAFFDLQRTTMDFSINSFEYSKITKVLDKESRNLYPAHVKFFIFSSFALHRDDLRDPIVEKLCYQRKESGHHGLFILLPNFIPNTNTETRSRNIYYTKMSFLRQLSTLLATDASVIALRTKIKDHYDDFVALEISKETNSLPYCNPKNGAYD